MSQNKENTHPYQIHANQTRPTKTSNTQKIENSLKFESLLQNLTRQFSVKVTHFAFFCFFFLSLKPSSL
jgi:hypothetical protein